MIAQIVPVCRMPINLKFFDYGVPTGLEKQIQVGQLVHIPLRKKEVFGVVLNVLESSSIKSPAKLKDIIDIVIDNPVLNSKQLNFLLEMSDFYHTSLGFLVKSNLMPLQPRKLKSLAGEKVLKMKNEKTKPKKPSLIKYSTHTEKNKYIVQQLNNKKQNLILDPEINAIKNIILPDELQTQAVVITSELSPKEFFTAWMDIWTGKKNIIIGTRRALFLPWINLANIFLIDEGSPNYKSWDMAPRLQVRDSVLILQKYQGSELHLLTHTPSVESYFFAKAKVYKNLSISDNKTQKNTPELIDMRIERKAGNYDFLSDKLTEIIKTHKDKNIFLFLNKRGSSSYVGCRDCGYVAKCKKCNVLLSWHDDKKSLMCHYCNTTQKLSHNCPKCNGISMVMHGAGTQLAENQVQKILNLTDKSKILRIDKDKPNTQKSSANIIIGTRLAWSFVDWKNLDLVALVDADTSLFIPEYKVSENLRFLIRDIQYKLSAKAKFFIQTSHLDHTVFANLQKPEQFYSQELRERQFLGYPPYKFLLKMFYGHANKQMAKNTANQLHSVLKSLTKDNKSIKLTDSIETTPHYYRGKYWQVVLAKIDYANYKRDTIKILKLLPIGWKVDPNPNSILSI